MPPSLIVAARDAPRNGNPCVDAGRILLDEQLPPQTRGRYISGQGSSELPPLRATLSKPRTRTATGLTPLAPSRVRAPTSPDSRHHPTPPPWPARATPFQAVDNPLCALQAEPAVRPAIWPVGARPVTSRGRHFDNSLLQICSSCSTKQRYRTIRYNTVLRCFSRDSFVRRGSEKGIFGT